MEFSKELRDDVAAGDITVTFRLWRRPHAKVGGRYRVGLVEIEVDRMELVPFAAVTDADVRRAGEPDRETLRHAPHMRDRSPTTRSCTGLRSTWSGSRREDGDREFGGPTRHTTTRRTTCSNAPSATGR